MNDGRSALTQALILTRPTDASVEPNLPIGYVQGEEGEREEGEGGIWSHDMCICLSLPPSLLPYSIVTIPILLPGAWA